MHTAILLAGYAIALGAALCAVFYLGVLIATIRGTRGAPSLQRGPMKAPDDYPSLCVLVPAHNEERSIERVARSLLAQEYPDLRIIFVLDRCTDETNNILRVLCADDDRVEIYENHECPEDWAGKPHALWRGLQDCRGADGAEFLLFLDADTEVAPNCLEHAVGILLEQDADLLSALSTLESHGWWEDVCQPAAVFELMSHFKIRNVNRGRRSFANGQFMMWRRASYDRLGGHEAARSELLEDIAMARLARRTGMRTCLALADRQLLCRMYDDPTQYVRGWKRIYIESAKRSTRRLLRWRRRILVTDLLLPGVALLAVLLGVAAFIGGETDLAMALLLSGAAGYGAMTFAYARIHRIQSAPVWSAALHPIGALSVAKLLGDAAREISSGVAVKWAGRSYVRPAR